MAKTPTTQRIRLGRSGGSLYDHMRLAWEEIEDTSSAAQHEARERTALTFLGHAGKDVLTSPEVEREGLFLRHGWHPIRNG